MSLFSWLRRNPSSERKAAKTNRFSMGNRFRPGLEPLEDRAVPAIFNVTTTADVVNQNDEYLSLREAVQAANATNGADTINAPAGHYLLSEGTLELAGHVAVAGAEDGGTIFDGQHLGGVLDVLSDADVNLSNVTVQNSLWTGISVTDATLTMTRCTVSGNAGSGIDNGLGNVTIDNCTIRGNSDSGINNFTEYLHGRLSIRGSTIADNTASYKGGGIRNNGAMTISDSTISGNRATDGYRIGGGIYNTALADVAVTRCLITDNSARDGGGIFNEGWSMTVADSTIARNFARGGGGIANWFWRPLVLRNCLVTGNMAISGHPLVGGTGGGVLGIVTMIDCTLSNNFSDGIGGAAYLTGQSVVNHCNFVGNLADKGGAIYVEYGDVTIRNSTITGNTATESGGGIANFGTLSILDSTLTGNTAALGADLYNAALVYVYDSLIGDRYDV